MPLHQRLLGFGHEAGRLVRARSSAPGEPEARARARERRRRVVLSAISSSIARLISIATVLISVPLTLHYLGAERYGMWMTISSLIAMVSFADLGMGNGLLNSIARAHGQGDQASIRRFISSGFTVLSGIACVLLVGFALCYPWLNWSKLFNSRGAVAQSEAGPALATFVAFFALNIPLAVVGRVQSGLQQAFIASLWQCAGSVLALASMILAIHLEGGLPWLVASAFGAQALAAALNTAIFFGRVRPDLKPRLHEVSRGAIGQIASTGVLFLVLQVVVAVAYASDNLVIAQMLGAGAVTEYAIPEKLFSLIAMALGILLAPLWPAYGEAIARGDIIWVRGAFGRSLLIALGLASTMSVVLVLSASSLISMWVGHSVNPPLSLLVGLGLWKVIEAAGNAMAMLLNGANIVRIQVVAGVLTGIAALTLKLVLVPSMGVAGTVWASIVSFSLISLIPLAVWAVPQALGNDPARAARVHA